MTRMAARRGRHKARRLSFPLTGLVLHLLGAVLAGVAWLVLVRVAIDLGTDARTDGDARDWGYVVLTGVAAVVALVLAMQLIARTLRRLGLVSDYRSRHARRH